MYRPGSRAGLPREFLALEMNFAFEFIEEGRVLLSHSLYQTGDQQLARGLRAGEEAGNEFAGAFVFVVAAGEAGGIEKGALGFPPFEKSLFEETVERSHDCGVCEGTA